MMKRLLNLLLVLGAVGCGHNDADPETTAIPSQANGPAKEGTSSEPLAVLEELGGKTVQNEQGIIVQLDLDNTQCNDDALSHLASLPHLQELWLDGTEITDAGLTRLSHLKELKLLTLNETPITDAGLAQRVRSTLIAAPPNGMVLVDTETGLEARRNLMIWMIYFRDL